MSRRRFAQTVFRAAVSVVGVLAALWLGGCATANPVTVGATRAAATLASPAVELVPAHEAWRLAEEFARTQPDAEAWVGSGDSMRPLYRDHTVLVVRRIAMSELHAGMTVLYLGDNGRPVAHTLMERTVRGWRVVGLGNAEPDETLVRYNNYIGTVIRAYWPAERGAGLADTARTSEKSSLRGALALANE